MAVAKLSKRKRTAYEQYLRDLHDEASWNAHQRFKNETLMEFKLAQTKGGKTIFQGRVCFVFKMLLRNILKTKHTRP
ncbi:MAG: hypothetical protein RL329_3216 [Bacteroidota bacterium]